MAVALGGHLASAGMLCDCKIGYWVIDLEGLVTFRVIKKHIPGGGLQSMANSIQQLFHSAYQQHLHAATAIGFLALLLYVLR